MAEASTMPSIAICWRFSVPTLAESMPVESADALVRAAFHPKRVQS